MSDTLNLYTVTINFAGYLGADQDYDVYAKDRDSAIEEEREEARMDLSAESIEQISDDEWEVELGFAGLVGVSEFYTVYADSEDDAEDKAKDEAYWDFSAEEINGVLVDDFNEDTSTT